MWGHDRKRFNYCLSTTGRQAGTGLLQVEASLTKKGYISVVFYSRLKTQNYHFKDNMKHKEGIADGRNIRSRRHEFFGRNQERFIET